MDLEPQELVRQARTLAQAHPLTPLASQLINKAVAEQQSSQPIAEAGAWAGAAVVNGYCLRRVEENEAGMVLQHRTEADVDVERLDREADRIAAQLRDADATPPFLFDDGAVLAALDRLIDTEVSRRMENLRHAIDDAASGELEEYLTWWTVKGYALRAAEQAVGAVA